MGWVSVKKRLPEVGTEVYVHGSYTSDDQPKPKAKLVNPESYQGQFGGPWQSTEWRGEVAITHWWEEDTQEACKYMALAGDEIEAASDFVLILDEAEAQ